MLKRLFSSLLDEMMVFGGSVVVFFIAQQVLKLIGFKMKEPLIFLLIFYGILNVLYFAICEGSKNGKTLAKRILKID